MNYLQPTVVAYFTKAVRLEQTDKVKAMHFYELAYEAQKVAAFMEQDQSVKAILLLNAACMAIRIKLYREALELAEQGLAYNPPTEIAKQLQETVAYASKFLDIKE
jgi:hypothetical protein